MPGLPPAIMSDPDSPVPQPPDASSATARWQRIRKASGPLLGLLVLLLALWGLYGMLRSSSLEDIAAALRALPPQDTALALGCTVLSYLALTLYDRLALAWLGLVLPWRRTAPATALAYALGNVSFNAMVVGAAVRFSSFRQFAMGPGQVARVAVFASLGFWLGYLTLGGLLFALDPLNHAVQVAGLIILLPAIYLLLAWRLPVFRLGRWELPLPPPRLCIGQITVGVLDLLGISSVLWLLLPPLPGLSYSHFLQAFMLAMVAGTASQSPGGLGVFDSAFLLLLPAGTPAPPVVAALLAFRATYYGVPLLAAAVLLVLREGRRRLLAWRAKAS
jgi:uncharacterized membrane protein YbhN (UPF0104 family)